jgi:putative ABC transport system substrate-binding protein
MMSSTFEEAGAALENASGVTYEIPAVTAFVNLRSVIQRPVNRVGVLHRPGFRAFLDRQKALAATEQITVVPIEVPATPSTADIRQALQSLQRTAGGIDALWVLNDNELLRGEQFLKDAWRPGAAALGVPVVVGSPALVSPEAHFGTLAVVPDLDALGVQAADLLYEIAEDEWSADDHPVELPVSTVTVVNMRQVRQKFGLREGAMQRIDKAIE